MQDDIGIHKNYKPLALCSVLRYRFFFFAGIFPYILGQIIAYHINGSLNYLYLWLGFLGILLVLTGVELFNEYFDAKEGGDRIFSKEPVKIPHHFFPLALCSMLFAFLIGLYLTFQTGWPILLFSLLGFLGAYFYVGPPIRWAYRGFGEIVIASCYGPFMLLGSFYLQARSIESVPLFISFICGLSLFCLAVLNEIPDYYQDKIVGKRNIVVRLGKKKAIRLLMISLVVLFFLLGIGITIGKIPIAGLLSFLTIPWLFKSFTIIKRDYENPANFALAINMNLAIYLVIMFSLGAGYLR